MSADTDRAHSYPPLPIPGLSPCGNRPWPRLGQRSTARSRRITLTLSKTGFRRRFSVIWAPCILASALLLSLAGPARALPDIIEADWSTVLPPDAVPPAYASGDLNGDEYPEIVLATRDGRILVYSHEGKPMWTRRSGSRISLIACGNIGSQRGPEIVVAGPQGIEILDGQGRLRHRVTLRHQAGDCRGLRLVDCDADSILDVVALRGSEVDIIHRQVAAKLETRVLSLDAGFAPRGLWVGDLDSDNYPDFAVADQGLVVAQGEMAPRCGVIICPKECLCFSLGSQSRLPSPGRPERVS